MKAAGVQPRQKGASVIGRSSRRLAVVAVIGFAIVAAGCGGPGVPGGGGGGASQPLEQQLPDEINGVALETEVVSATDPDSESGLSVDDELLDAIVEMGGSRDSVEVGSAFDPSRELEVSIIGLRAPGADPARLRDQFVETVEEDTGEELEQRSVGGRDVMVGETEFGTVYLYFRGDTVFQVIAQNEEDAAAALSALP